MRSHSTCDPPVQSWVPWKGRQAAKQAPTDHASTRGNEAATCRATHLLPTESPLLHALGVLAELAAALLTPKRPGGERRNHRRAAARAVQTGRAIPQTQAQGPTARLGSASDAIGGPAACCPALSGPGERAVAAVGATHSAEIGEGWKRTAGSNKINLD